MTTRSSAELRRWARNEVITSGRMRALGFSRGEIRSLQRRELLFPAHTGVFFLGANPSQQSIWTAAVARCSKRALLSHLSAAVLWRLLTHDPGWPHVTVPRGSIDTCIEGIKVHETTRPTERAERSLIPVTTLARTIDDCARLLSPRAIKSLIRQAEHHHSLDLERLSDQATSAKLRQTLRLYVPGQGKTDSELEADYFEISARAGLPTPLLQRAVPGGRADFIYPTLMLIVEVDGYEAHKGRVAFRDDRARDRANARRGCGTVRFTWEDIRLEPEAVTEDLVEIAAGRW